MKYLILLISLSNPAFAKRVMVPPPVTVEGLPAEELRSLGKRLGEALRKCPSMKNGAAATIEIKDLTGKGLDTKLVQQAIGKELSVAEGASGPYVDLHGKISYREWKSGKYSSTYTLEAVANAGGKEICKKLHRTVVKRSGK